MAWLIDVDKLFENLRKDAEDRFDPLVNSIILAQPRAVADEVVRCRDCVWYENGKEYAPYCDNPCSELQHPNDETFCSYGERKTE